MNKIEELRKLTTEELNNKIKENKEELSMTMVYQYRKAEISLKEILEYHDGEKVIKYLQERGLKNYEQNKFKTI